MYHDRVTGGGGGAHNSHDIRMDRQIYIIQVGTNGLYDLRLQYKVF